MQHEPLGQPIENATNPTFQLFTRARRETEGGTRAGAWGEALVKSIEELNWYISQSLTSPSHPLELTTLQVAVAEAR